MVSSRFVNKLYVAICVLKYIYISWDLSSKAV